MNWASGEYAPTFGREFQEGLGFTRQCSAGLNFGLFFHRTHQFGDLRVEPADLEGQASPELMSLLNAMTTHHGKRLAAAGVSKITYDPNSNSNLSELVPLAFERATTWAEETQPLNDTEAETGPQEE